MPAVTKADELFDPRAHVPLTERAWDADRARAAIGAIVAETERAFTHESLWPPHLLDEAEDEAPLQRPACQYLGAAGVIWALHALQRAGVAELGRDWGAVAASLSERYREEPDFPEDGVMPSLSFGEAGSCWSRTRWPRAAGRRNGCWKPFA